MLDPDPGNPVRQVFRQIGTAEYLIGIRQTGDVGSYHAVELASPDHGGTKPLFPHFFHDLFLHRKPAKLLPQRHFLHEDGFAGADPDQHIDLIILHAVGDGVVSAEIDRAAPLSDIIVGNAVSFQHPAAKQFIGRALGRHGQRNGQLFLPDIIQRPEGHRVARDEMQTRFIPDAEHGHQGVVFFLVGFRPVEGRAQWYGLGM